MPKLNGTRAGRFPPLARRAAREARQVRAAEEESGNVAPIVKVLQAAGVTSLNGIAMALNARGSLRLRVAVIGMRYRSRDC